MSLKKAIVTVAITSSLLGCVSDDTGPGKNFGWKTLSPPVEKALGRYVERDSGNVYLGGIGYTISDDTVFTSPSYNDVKSEDYSNYKLGAEASFKGVLAKAGIEHSANDSSSASGWSVTQIKDFSRGAPIDKEFVYKCIMVSDYTFEAKSKTSANLDLDASTLAKTFGVSVAKINLSTSPESPDSLKIIVKNPNLCLSYVSAKLSTPWLGGKGKVNTVTKNDENNVNKSNFNLKLNESSEPRSADLGNSAKERKPLYRLTVRGTQDAPVLSIWREDRENIDAPPVYFPLKEKAPGQWFGQYGIEQYYYSDMKYALIRIEIDAKILPDKSIQVKSAEIYSQKLNLSLR
ncbi:hypothetical protein [Pseudomonas marginalis]|uniref:hypothetical protein n=1 Tax=Pseudomonas marginalis TaxID=298 RepID=UPI00126CB774|nr:hypothetical protein [Pseudomonas marginalis]KAA8552333.1 hypothetical protein FX984_04844 [Pseudomonas marginalis]